MINLVLTTLAFLYPAYATYYDPRPTDDVKWLIFWTIAAMLEVIYNEILYWIPMMSFLKFGFLLFLQQQSKDAIVTVISNFVK